MSKLTELTTWPTNVLTLPPAADPGHGYIYFWLCVGADTFVKIGRATNLATRLSESQVGCPYVLHPTAWFYTDNPKRDEATLHERFRHLAVRGEWFRLDDDLTSVIVNFRSLLSQAVTRFFDLLGPARHVSEIKAQTPSRPIPVYEEQPKTKRASRGNFVWRGKERPL